MQQLSEHELSLKHIAHVDDNQSPRSEIWLHEKATGQIIDGAVLEAAVNAGGRYLLFVTDDIPYEETLRIYLLNADLITLDYATLGAPYSTGAFRSFEITSHDTVHFSFIGACMWSLRVLAQKHFHLPFISDPRGISRKLQLATHLKFDGKPIAEDAR